MQKEFIDYLRELDEVRQFVIAQDIELAARDRRIAELEAALQDLYGLTISMETLYSTGWQDIDEYVTGMKKARAALAPKEGGEP